MRHKLLWLFVATVVSAVSCAVLRTVPVGLRFADDEAGTVSIVCGTNLPDGQAVESGRVSWNVPVSAGHFKFVFPPRERPYRLQALTLFGIDAFSAAWLVPHVAPTQPIYAPTSLREGEPLELIATTDVCELDFRRFFDLLPHLFKLARWGMTLLPFFLLFGVWVALWIVPRLARLESPRIFAFALAVLSLLSFPDPIMPAVPGLDDSWQWLLNHLAFTPSFGRDVVFTYGPLGFLLYPQLGWGQALCALAANLLHVIGWCVLLWRVYRSSDAGRTAAWGLLATMLLPQETMEWRWVLLAIMATAVPVYLDGEGERRFRQVALAFGGLLLGIASLMKFTSLVSIAATQVFCLVVLFCARRDEWRCGILSYACSALLAFTVLSCLCFPSFAAFLGWVKGSLATATGYNLYMGGVKSYWELSIPVCAIVGTVAALVVWSKRSWAGVLPLALFSPFVFTAVKYAWVRQTARPLMYGLCVCFCLALWRAPWLKLRYAFLVAAFWLVSVAIAAPYLLSGLGGGMFVFGVNPMGIVRTVCLRGEISRACAVAAKRVPECDIPPAWRERIGSGTVLFAPFEMGPAMADNTQFNVVPLPSMQLYSACHPYLDELNASLINGSSPPDWMICNINVDWSGHLVGYPRFWSAVLCVYEYAAATDKYVLMKRRGRPVVEPQWAVVDNRIVRQNEWTAFPPDGGRAFSVEWKRTLLGRFCGAFMRMTPCYATFRFADGREYRCQMIADNAVCPYPLDRIPVDDGDFIKVLKGENVSPVVAVRFDAETSSLYGDEIHVSQHR